MKKILGALLLVLLAIPLYAADTKTTALTADTAPTTDDLVMTVNDPGGTPANRKVTLGNFATAIATLFGTTTFGAGSAITWTFNASGGTDTTLTFGDGTLAYSGLFTSTAGAALGNGSTGPGFLRLLEDTDNGTDYSTITGAADAGSYPAFTFGGSQGSEDLTLTASSNTWTVSSSTGVTKLDFSALNLATTGVITGAVNTNSDADGMSSSEMTAAGLYGTMFWATGAGTWSLPGAATGMNFCIYSTTAAAVVINPDDGDTIVLNGTALSAGDSITSASGAGDFICLLAKDANTWYTLGRSGTWTDTN